MTDLRLLEREMYAEAEAARLLDVAPSTLHYWLEGKTGRGGKVHRPVIRQEPKGTGAPVTWAEFVEAGLLRQYRRELKVRLLSCAPSSTCFGRASTSRTRSRTSAPTSVAASSSCRHRRPPSCPVSYGS
ncbi:MAG: hypothetical protein M3486_01290 [Actinomycetota bacterium]|nr:hypothetical protein [Actinomycetota bacterium]